MTESTPPLDLTAVPGISVGHAQDLTACTGCTVVLCPPGGARAAAFVRGMASSTRQLGIADPRHLVDRVHAVLLAGGSAFGLDAAAGVMRFLEARGEGFATAHARIPTVPTAILYDVGLGDPSARPSPEMAERACYEASSVMVPQGCVGAGAGATIGKLLSVRCATKGGLGSAARRGGEDLVVGAIAAVNAFGDLFDPRRRAIVAGARRSPDRLELLDSARQISAGMMPKTFGQAGTNTTLAVIATNAKLDGQWLRRVAEWASDALSLWLRPAFTAVDGDVVIALSTAEVEAEPHRVGLLAREVLGESILRAALAATPLAGLPCASQLEPRFVEPEELY